MGVGRFGSKVILRYRTVGTRDIGILGAGGITSKHSFIIRQPIFLPFQVQMTRKTILRLSHSDILHETTPVIISVFRYALAIPWFPYAFRVALNSLSPRGFHHCNGRGKFSKMGITSTRLLPTMNLDSDFAEELYRTSD